MGGVFDVDFIARKLRIIILLRFGLVTFRFHYWKTRKLIICIVLGPGGRDHDSPNQLFIFGDTRTFQIIQEQFQILSPKIVFLKIRELGFLKMLEMCVPCIFESRNSKFENLELWNIDILQLLNFDSSKL